MCLSRYVLGECGSSTVSSFEKSSKKSSTKLMSTTMMEPAMPRMKTPDAMYMAAELKEWNINSVWAGAGQSGVNEV